MGLTEKREALLKQLPIIKTRILRSKDSKYLIHRVEITDIKPINYYKAILDDTSSISEEMIDDELAAALDEV